MAEPNYATDAEVSLILGGTGTGKTTRLANKVARLLDQGENPENIVFFAASPAAAQAAARKLEQICGSPEASKLVTTPRDYALKLLGGLPDELGRLRRPRTLLGFEEAVLMEDLKTSGVAPKRLAQMLRFLYRSQADLEPMDEGWFYSGEEQRVFELLQGHLAYRGAWPAALLARVAWDRAHLHRDLLEPMRYDHVIADDYQTLSCASQCLVALAARTSLSVAADPVALVRAADEYPSFQGPSRLAEANPPCDLSRLTLCHLSAAVTEGLNRLRADEALGADEPLDVISCEQGRCEAIDLGRPNEELVGIADLVEQRIARPTAPASIAIVAPNRSRLACVARELDRRGIPVSTVSAARVGADLRPDGECRCAKALTLLRLTADPSDPLALRTWCGFGDYLANSSLADAVVRGRARLSLGGVSWEAAEPTALQAQESAQADQALAEARDLLATIGPFTGSALLDAACNAAGTERAAMPAPVRRAVEALGDAATADRIVQAAEEEGVGQGLVGEGVMLALPEDMVGQKADVVILSGQVNGLVLPRRYFDPAQLERDRRAPMLSSEMARCYACAGKARTDLFFTYFTESPLGEAEATGLRICRVRLRHGERVCETSPSETIRSITGVSFDD